MDILTFFESIASRIPGSDWLMSQGQHDFKPADFYLTFNLVHRKIEPQPLNFTQAELSTWHSIYPGFKPEFWDSRAIARTYLILLIPTANLGKVLDDLFTTGDIGEQETLYRLLYLLPQADRFHKRAAEGIRTNMTRVYDAIALDNPYPAEYFDDGQWNQMVLKAIFMERPLYRIKGIDRRNNKDLCRIARDFAHERWAAGRLVTPELWRLTGIFADEEAGLLNDLDKVLSSSDALERTAAILAMSESSDDKYRSLIEYEKDSMTATSWEELGMQIEERK